jgi:hypothetical protein
VNETDHKLKTLERRLRMRELQLLESTMTVLITQGFTDAKKDYFLRHEYDGCFKIYASPDHSVYILLPFDVNADTGPVELQRGTTQQCESHFRNAFRYARLLDV